MSSVRKIFEKYYNGEVNIMTPNVYEYGELIFDSEWLLFEKSKGEGLFSPKELFGVSFLILNNKGVQKIDLGQCFFTKKEADDYVKSITPRMVLEADRYGEVKQLY